MAEMTQTDKIYRHMQDYGSITSMEAFSEYGCTRLSARIWDLQHQRGLNIKRETMSGKNRYGDTITFTKYSLEV